MADVRVNRSLAREFARTTETKAAVEKAAEKVAARAKDLAPDDPRTAGSSIAEGIKAETGMTRDGWVGRVNATDWKSHFLEFGTSRTPAKPYLRPAAEAEGLKIKEKRT